MYYDGELIADESIDRRTPLRESLSLFWPRRSNKFPIMFCDVVGKEMDNRSSAVFKGSVDSHSKSNHEEAEKTVRMKELLAFTCAFVMYVFILIIARSH